MDLLGAVLTGRPVSEQEVLTIVQRREREGLYLEYKRGLWLAAEKSPGHELREYTSGFANAEGGLLIVGVVGGEEAQGDQKWTIESASCPDKAGWDSWLSHVLEPIGARTRVRWQVVLVDGQEVVLVATDRAEALIRVYEKPDLVCYLRIGDETIKIDDTLFADLALGRRAKPDLRLTFESVMQGGRDSLGFYLNIAVTVHNQGLVWVPDLKVAWVGYSHNLMRAQESLTRYIDVRATTSAGPQVTITEFDSRVRLTRDSNFRESISGRNQDLRPFESAEFGARVQGLPASEEAVQWVWAGAILVLPQQASPLWAQVAVKGIGHERPTVQAWVPPIGTAPVVLWAWDRGRPSEFAEIFGEHEPPGTWP
jgi:hypothetical protein